jgi:hypothetical protein
MKDRVTVFGEVVRDVSKRLVEELEPTDECPELLTMMRADNGCVKKSPFHCTHEGFPYFLSYWFRTFQPNFAAYLMPIWDEEYGEGLLVIAADHTREEYWESPVTRYPDQHPTVGEWIDTTKDHQGDTVFLCGLLRECSHPLPKRGV